MVVQSGILKNSFDSPYGSNFGAVLSVILTIIKIILRLYNAITVMFLISKKKKTNVGTCFQFTLKRSTVYKFHDTFFPISFVFPLSRREKTVVKQPRGFLCVCSPAFRLFQFTAAFVIVVFAVYIIIKTFVEYANKCVVLCVITCLVPMVLFVRFLSVQFCIKSRSAGNQFQTRRYKLQVKVVFRVFMFRFKKINSSCFLLFLVDISNAVHTYKFKVRIITLAVGRIQRQGRSTYT